MDQQQPVDEAKRPTAAPRQNTSSRRASSFAPKPPLSLDSTSIVANHVQLVGIHPVTIGPNSVINPHARINSTNCSVAIGAGCIIAEKASIGLSGLSQDSMDASHLETIKIGDNVRIESNAVIEAEFIGEYSIVDVDAQIGAGAIIGKHCIITACCVIAANARVPDFTVIMVDGRSRKNTTLESTPVVADIQAKGHQKHLKVLTRLVPDMRVKLQ